MRKQISALLIAFLLAAPLGSASAAPAPLGRYSEANAPQAAAGALHYLTIPASAFHPADDDYDYEIHGRYLIHHGQAGQNLPGIYLAAVNLPQGAHIEKVTYFWKDPGPPGFTGASIQRSLRWTDIMETVAGAPSSYDVWAPSFGSTSSYPPHFSIDQPINNFAYNYYVRIDISGGGVTWGCAFQIEYTLPASAPTPIAISVPSAAFTPYSAGHDYFNDGWNLDTFAGPASLFGRGWYVAPVYLPDGATVTSFSFHWKRLATTSSTATAHLQRTCLSNGSYDILASAASTAGAGPFNGSTFTTSISYAQILNQICSYYVILDVPAGNPVEVDGREAVVEYILPTPYNYVLAVPAGAFQPFENGYSFQNGGFSLLHQYGPGGSSANGWYVAPVNLPDGALINKMEFHWFEDSTVAGVARLQRTTLNVGDYSELATVWTSTGTNSGGSASDTTVAGGRVDNSRYAYWLIIDIPSNAFLINIVRAHQVRLSYSMPLYLPLIQN